ncbi:hypothetical protein [Hymenobacter glacieicola]|uniref:Uncharacterized protein n=1 Tax=Hymenobacter glacieicola TaxID=1562124 RepID=A0ABQ1X566_9BACT|nr:hypothetical protein [Hymenobacter glacieicola]GGG60503.1 hypothetical protein GCM10011378_40650 [Hymenobacter glacieicola]
MVTTYYSNKLTAAPIIPHYTIGEAWDENTRWQYNGLWLYYAGEYINGACYYLDPGVVATATLDLPVKGNALEVNHGTDPAPTASLFQIREVGSTTWSNLGVVPAFGPHILPLPSSTRYYYVRITNDPNSSDKYVIVDYVKII